MLEEDIKKMGSFVETYSMSASSTKESWSRIKTALAEAQPQADNISRDAIALLLDDIVYWQKKKFDREFIIGRMVEKISIAQQHPC